MSEQLGDLHIHLPGEGLATLYRRWAAGGIGLCMTGNVMIDRRALGEPRNVVLEPGVSVIARKILPPKSARGLEAVSACC